MRLSRTTTAGSTSSATRLPTGCSISVAFNPASRTYTLAKTIVHGLLVLMVWPVDVSVPVAWLTVNCTIVSVFFSSGGPKPSSALAA